MNERYTIPAPPGKPMAESKKRKKLIILVGPLFSGKSEWAETSGYPVVKPSDIRRTLFDPEADWEDKKHIWGTIRNTVKLLFDAGNNVLVLDSCNLSKKSRRYWNSPDWDCEYILFDRPKEAIIADAVKTGNDQLLHRVHMQLKRPFTKGIPPDKMTTLVFNK